jgi:hypothetical protein
MILSRVHRFLFIKTRKVGGTSVEIALSPFCGAEDIVTPITPIDEHERMRRGGRSQNYCPDPRLEAWYREQVREGAGRLGDIPARIKARQIFYNHMPYSELRTRAAEPLESYFRFTIERHPYEKVLSLANMLITFEAYSKGGSRRASAVELERVIAGLFESGRVAGVRNFDLYAENGRAAVDRILRYESLSEELGAVCRHLGLEPLPELPAAKMGQRDRSVAAADLLTDRQKRRLQVLCREEFEAMRYET